MAEKIKVKIAELKNLTGKDVLCLVYNPAMDGLRPRDYEYLYFLLSKAKLNFPLVILSGTGGDFRAGILFPYLIEKFVKKYKVCVPTVCGSALTYAVFKAQELLLGPDAKLTQIDPMFAYSGESLRAIKHLNSSDDNLKEEARKVFDLAQKQIKELSTPPSLFKFKLNDPGEWQHRDNIASYFMNKETHEKPITMKELNELEANAKEITNTVISDATKALVQCCQDFTMSNNHRFVFASSTQLSYDSETGQIICPPIEG